MGGNARRDPKTDSYKNPRHKLRRLTYSCRLPFSVPPLTFPTRFPGPTIRGVRLPIRESVWRPGFHPCGGRRNVPLRFHTLPFAFLFLIRHRLVVHEVSRRESRRRCRDRSRRRLYTFWNRSRRRPRERCRCQWRLVIFSRPLSAAAVLACLGRVGDRSGTQRRLCRGITGA